MSEEKYYLEPRPYFRWALRKGIRPDSLVSALNEASKNPVLFPEVVIGRDALRFKGSWYVLASDLDKKLCL